MQNGTKKKLSQETLNTVCSDQTTNFAPKDIKRSIMNRVTITLKKNYEKKWLKE